MAQGIFGGATSYEEQSLKDILGDIEYWIKYTCNHCKEMKNWLNISKESKFWEKVDIDFQLTIISSIYYFKTIISDLEIVKKAIDTNCITQKEVRLLSRIGHKAIMYNMEYPKTYNSDKVVWHDYGNPDFKVVEKMYAEGRDYFVTLQDACNAANRLEDYIESGQIINNTINFSGNVSETQIQQGIINSSEIIKKSEQMNYAEVLDILEEIKQYSTNELFANEFGDKEEEIRLLIDEAIKNAKYEKNSSILKRTLSKMMELVEGVGTGIIASGIFKLLEQCLNK